MCTKFILLWASSEEAEIICRLGIVVIKVRDLLMLFHSPYPSQAEWKKYDWVFITQTVTNLFHSSIAPFLKTIRCALGKRVRSSGAWLPDGYSRLFRLFVFGPLSLKDYGSATLRCKI